MKDFCRIVVPLCLRYKFENTIQQSDIVGTRRDSISIWYDLWILAVRAYCLFIRIFILPNLMKTCSNNSLHFIVELQL